MKWLPLLMFGCAPVSAHFVTLKGQPLDQYEDVWQVVADVCEGLPAQIKIGEEPSKAALARAQLRSCLPERLHNEPLLRGLLLVAAAEAEGQLAALRRAVHAKAASGAASLPADDEASASFLLFVRSRFGKNGVSALFFSYARKGSWDGAYAEALRKTPAEAEAAWQRFLATLEQEPAMLSE